MERSENQAAFVLGMDIDDTRIRKAEFIRSLFDLGHVEFRVIDLYSEAFRSLPSFDLAICFGLTHRLPDPFNFISVLAERVEAVLFEWIVAPPLMDQNVPRALHRQGGLYEWQNAVGNFEAREIASQGRGGGGVDRVSYWNLSFGALEAMCERSGLVHFIRCCRGDGYPDHSADPGTLTRRVMLLASKEPTSLMGRDSREGRAKWSNPKVGAYYS